MVSDSTVYSFVARDLYKQNLHFVSAQSLGIYMYGYNATCECICEHKVNLCITIAHM